MWNLMTKLNYQAKQRQTHRPRKQADSFGWWGGGRGTRGWRFCGKKKKKREDKDNSVVIVRQREMGRGGRGHGGYKW